MRRSVHHIDTGDRYFTGDPRRLISTRDGHCRMPTCTSPIRDADHIIGHRDGGPTSTSNGQGQSVRCHHLRDLPGWTVTGTADQVTWTTPTGHRYTSRPPPALGWGRDE